jgi:hypothetical protein
MVAGVLPGTSWGAWAGWGSRPGLTMEVEPNRATNARARRKTAGAVTLRIARMGLVS